MFYKNLFNYHFLKILGNILILIKIFDTFEEKEFDIPPYKRIRTDPTPMINAFEDFDEMPYLRIRTDPTFVQKR